MRKVRDEGGRKVTDEGGREGRRRERHWTVGEKSVRKGRRMLGDGACVGGGERSRGGDDGGEVRGGRGGAAGWMRGGASALHEAMDNNSKTKH